MLVLSRKLDQEIVIDGGIRIRVVEIKGNQVRLGISAPPDVAVHREEIHRSITQWRSAAEPALHS